MGYIIDWLKKARIMGTGRTIALTDMLRLGCSLMCSCCALQFMFRVLLIDCWSPYILDIEKKEFMVLDPTETDPADEMNRKHKALARKFQLRLCHHFNDMFGAGLVETIGWTFMYLLVGQHEPCTRRVCSFGSIKINFGTLQLLKAMMEIPCSPGRKVTSTSWGSPGFSFVQCLAR